LLKPAGLKPVNRKKTISGQHMFNYHNFIRFTSMLFRLDTRIKKMVRELKKQIEATEHVAGKTWLLEKMDELI
jgi:hypothetical protein